MKHLLVIGALMLSVNTIGQVTGTDTTTNEPLNSVANIIAGNSTSVVEIANLQELNQLSNGCPYYRI